MATTDDLGIRVSISIGDLSLAEAKDAVEDGSLFDVTRIPILFHFPQVTVEGYWDLKVRDHAEMMAFLTGRGLFDG